MRNRTLLLFFIIHIVIFMGIFVVVSEFAYPAPGGIERHFALRMLSGEVPYRDFTSEYPPVALLSFLLPGFLFRTQLAYALAFAAEMLVLDLIVLVLIKSLAGRIKVSAWDALGVYTIFIVAVGPLLVVRYDMVPAVLVLLAVWAFMAERRKLAWVFVALGAMAKIYPIIIAPILAIRYLKQRQISSLVKGVAVLVLVILVLSVPFLIIDNNGFLYTFVYHAERGIQWESTYASALLVGQLLNITHVVGIFNFGSWNVSSSPLSDRLSSLSIFITIVLLLIVYAVYARRLWQKIEPTAGEHAALLLTFSSLAVLVFMLGNKVFSAQYLIWLCPLLPLFGGQKRYALWIMFIVAAAITQYLYPYQYLSLELAEPRMVVLLAVRNALLVAMAVILILPKSPVKEPRKSKVAEKSVSSTF